MMTSEVFRLLSMLRLAMLPQQAAAAAFATTDADIEMQVAVWAMTLEDIPDTVTAEDAYRAFCKSGSVFFPSAVEVANLLDPADLGDWSAAWSQVVAMSTNGPRWVETGWGDVDPVGIETAMDLAGATTIESCAAWWGARQLAGDGYLSELFRKAYTAKASGHRRVEIAATALGTTAVTPQIGAVG